VSDSFYWTHTAAIKCEALARSLTRRGDPIEDPFRRLYWLCFIYEGDFVSEISITLPSGLAKYEDLIPYPEFSKAQQHSSPAASIQVPASESPLPPIPPSPLAGTREEVVAFQVTTNAAIRRFLNRVNSVVYDNKEQYRAARANYATWLLRVAEDMWAHHTAIYRNLPGFLLTSLPPSPPDAASPGQQLGNIPWNVARLEGRCYAGQYIIHRPFVQYVLLNMPRFETHPCRDEILKRSRMCFDGCCSFIRVFDVEPANSITCLFATGMVYVGT